MYNYTIDDEVRAINELEVWASTPDFDTCRTNFLDKEYCSRGCGVIIWRLYRDAMKKNMSLFLTRLEETVGKKLDAKTFYHCPVNEFILYPVLNHNTAMVEWLIERNFGLTYWDHRESIVPAIYVSDDHGTTDNMKRQKTDSAGYIERVESVKETKLLVGRLGDMMCCAISNHDFKMLDWLHTTYRASKPTPMYWSTGGGKTTNISTPIHVMLWEAAVRSNHDVLNDAYDSNDESDDAAPEYIEASNEQAINWLIENNIKKPSPKWWYDECIEEAESGSNIVRTCAESLGIVSSNGFHKNCNYIMKQILSSCHTDKLLTDKLEFAGKKDMLARVFYSKMHIERYNGRWQPTLYLFDFLLDVVNVEPVRVPLLPPKDKTKYDGDGATYSVEDSFDDFIQHGLPSSPNDYSKKMYEWFRTKYLYAVCKHRMKNLREEIVAEAMSPNRIAYYVRSGYTTNLADCF